MVNFNELIGLIGIGILLIVCSTFLFLYSNKLVTFDSHVTTQKLSELVDADKELHLSTAETEHLIKLEIGKVEHLRRASKSFRRMFKCLSVFLSVLGLSQIVFIVYLFRRYKPNSPNQRDGADRKS